LAVSDLSETTVRAGSWTAGLVYAVVFGMCVGFPATVAGAPNSVVTLLVLLVAGACIARGVWMSVETDGQTLWVRNFWKEHVIQRDEVVRIDRQDMGFLTLFGFVPTNSDAPFIVLASGTRVPVVVGVGGNRKVEAVIARLGKGNVPDDGRMTPREGWERLRRWLRR
jgi:hypothetical protein